MLQDADLSGRHVDDAARYKKRRDLARAAGQHLVVIVFDEFDAADSGAHREADRMAVVFGNFETGIRDCIHRRSDAVVNERIGLAYILRQDVLAGIEIIHDTCNSCAECRCIEILDELDTRIAFADIGPGFVQPIAYRRDDSHAGNDDASFFQCSSVVEWQNCR